MIAPGNAVIFNVHPAAKNVSAYAMEIFNRTIVDNGGPANLISMLREPTMEGANELFHHPQIRLIAATGGPGLVKAAFAAGKKVVAAGPGNPPVVVDVTADLDRAAREIIKGASFDNNILCIAEKEVFVVDGVFDRFMQAMANAGAVRLNAAQIEMLTAKAFGKNDKGQVFVSRDLIGKNANVLAAIAGLTLPDQVRILYGETDKNHLFVQEEQMMPFLPIVRCPSVEQAIEWSVEAEHGFGHTAMIYSNHLETITRFTRAIDTDIVVVNGPSGAGNGGYSGEGYFSHTIASPTGEGICTPRDFARVRRLAIYENLQSSDCPLDRHSNENKLNQRITNGSYPQIERIQSWHKKHWAWSKPAVLSRQLKRLMRWSRRPMSNWSARPRSGVVWFLSSFAAMWVL
jgi:acyl-CoA reductase-like NAD-dependent aldehyde dehydrogenase